MRRTCMGALLLASLSVSGSAAFGQTGGSSMVPLPAAEMQAPRFQPIDPPPQPALPIIVQEVERSAPDSAGRLVVLRSFAIGLEPVPEIQRPEQSGLSGVPMPLATGAVTQLPVIAPPEPLRPEPRHEPLPPQPVAPQLVMQPLPPVVPQIVILPPQVTAPQVTAPPTSTPPTSTPPASATATSATPPSGEQFDTALARVAKLATHLPPQALAGLKAFYDSRQRTALFSDDGAISAKGRAVLDVARRGAEHGLDQQRFARLVELAETGDATEREVALAALAIAYARDARGARVNPAQVSRLITARPTLPEAQSVLEGLTAPESNVSAALEGWNPSHPGYKALRTQLQGMAAQAAPQAAPQAADIIVNMERWRWLPVALGHAHVMVNVPGYWLEYRRGGTKQFETRVIIGKPQTPTPIFSHQMEYLVVNPYWNVPPSIALKEYLPLLQANPYALQARGLEIVSRGKPVDPASVDWSRMPRSVAIRQPPGERNALGHIKFMFPNEHAVYLHDTPSRGLFSASRRAFSHGCVRVQNPFALATAISGWSESRLRGMVGGPERRLDLPGDVAVHLTYFTLEARDDGSLVSREDVYGHHRRMKRLMGL